MLEMNPAVIQDHLLLMLKAMIIFGLLSFYGHFFYSFNGSYMDRKQRVKKKDCLDIIWTVKVYEYEKK